MIQPTPLRSMHRLPIRRQQMRAPQPRRNDILNLTSPMKKVPPIIFGALLFFTPSFASAAFTYSRSITIDHTKVSANLSDFPVEVTLTNVTSLKNPAGGGHVQSSSGYDVYFYSDAALTSRLAAEREKFDGSAGTYIGWVKVPTLSPTSDAVIYMAYGDSGISSDPNSDATYGKTKVWDDGGSNYFEGVWHLNETGANPQVLDSTANGLNSTSAAWTPTKSGKIGSGGAFSTSNVTFPSIAPASITAEAWVYSTDFNQNGMVVMKDNVNASWELFFENNNVKWRGGANDQNVLYSAANISNSKWHYIAATQTGTSAILYVDGAQVDTGTNTAIGTGTEVLHIGNFQAAGYYFSGSIDEVRVSNSVRTPEWILAEYNNQSSPSKFYRLGNEISGGTSMVAPARFQLFGGFLRTIGGYLRLRGFYCPHNP